MNESEFATALNILRAGELVGIPSETVYGLGARADSDLAVQKIFDLKKRPAINPLISHVTDLDMARKYGILSAKAERLVKHYWPGPLTIVVPQGEKRLSKLVTAGLNTIALRAPKHEIFQSLIKALDIPIAAPSANPSGSLSPTMAKHVTKAFPNLFTLEGGDAKEGLESTVILALNDDITLLRRGTISQKEIENLLGEYITCEAESQTPKSPGQLLKHYAPKAKLVLDANTPNNHSVFIGFGAVKGDISLSKNGNIKEAEQTLFATLHKADELAQKNNKTTIQIAPIPENDDSLALLDRLHRASKASLS